MSNLKLEHYKHLKLSAIADDIIDLNFRSWSGRDETELDDVFSLLVENPKHRNNGTLSGSSNNNLANVLRDDGWIFEGYLGVSVKPDNPREGSDGKQIKYESVRNHQQLFVPRVSIRAAIAIAAKLGVERNIDVVQNPDSEDLEFWDWFQASGFPLIVTEGCKKACAVVSAGHPSIALNGVYGWGSNDKDMFGNDEVDDTGNKIKTLLLELTPFITDREVVMAFDFDDKPITIAYVNRALDRFAAKISDISSSVSRLKWTKSKGIDDLIVAKGVKNLDRIYSKRMEVKPSEEKSEKKPTAWQLSPKIALDVYGGTMRYDVEFKQYWEYKEGLWKQCSDEYIFALVKNYLDTVTENYPTRLVTETITFARGSILVPEWIEAESTKLMPFKNGVLDVVTMQLLPHDPSYGFRWQMPRDYSACENGWSHGNIDKFLSEFSSNNPELRNILLAFCNAILLGRSNLHKFLYLSGSGGNGKGVFTGLLEALVGSQNTCTTSLASLNDNRFEAANIKNKRLALCPDEDKKPDSLTVFKSATGGDNISCEYKGKQSVNFRFEGIFVIAANQPIFRGENHEAMKRRKVDFPCLNRPVTKDPELLNRLILDLPSFTTYVLSLDPGWVKKTIQEASSVGAISELAKEMSIREDSIAAYFYERLVVESSESIQSETLYKDYQSFCDANGLKPMSSSQFSPKLIELCSHSMGLNVFKKKGKTGAKIYGLRFRSTLDVDFDDVEGDGYPSPGDGEGDGFKPILGVKGDGGDGSRPIPYTGEEINNINNIDRKYIGVMEFNPSPPVTNSHNPTQQTVSKGDGSKSPSPSPSPIAIGDRVLIINSGKIGTVERIGRVDGKKGVYARIILDDGTDPRLVLVQYLTKI